MNIRIYTFTLLMSILSHTTVSADDTTVWRLVTDRGTTVAADSVSCLVAVDDAPTFSIMLVDGSWIPDVEYVTFRETDVQDITSPATTGGAVIADSKLCLSQLPTGSQVRLLSPNGRVLASQTVGHDAAACVDVSRLAGGTYIVETANGTFKFIKK